MKTFVNETGIILSFFPFQWEFGTYSNFPGNRVISLGPFQVGLFYPTTWKFKDNETFVDRMRYAHSVNIEWENKPPYYKRDIEFRIKHEIACLMEDDGYELEELTYQEIPLVDDWFGPLITLSYKGENTVVASYKEETRYTDENGNDVTDELRMKNRENLS